MKNVYRKIKEIRELKGYKQDDLANHLGLVRSSYNKIENGKTALTIENLQKIADFLGVSVKEIMFNEQSSQTDIEKDKLEQELKYLKTINAMLKDRVLYFQQVKAKARIKKITEDYEKEQKKLRVKYYKGIKEIFIKFGFDDVSTFFDDKDYHFYENEFEERYSKSPNYRKFKEENERLKNNWFSEADILTDEWEEIIKRIKKYAEEYLP